MKKNIKKIRKIKIISISILMSLLVISGTFAIYKNSTSSSKTVAIAEWDVSLNQTGVNNNLSVVAGYGSDTYTLNVRSLSEVDVVYDVVVSNLPSGVSVLVDGVSPSSTGSNSATFTNVGSILYSDTNKTKSNTLTFTASSGATLVNNQQVSINVIAKQAGY